MVRRGVGFGVAAGAGPLPPGATLPPGDAAVALLPPTVGITPAFVNSRADSARIPWTFGIMIDPRGSPAPPLCTSP